MTHKTIAQYDPHYERTVIQKMGRLRVVHWLVIVMSLMLTLGAWQITEDQIAQRGKERFDAAAGQIIGLMHERMEKYEDALRGGVATIKAAGGEMSPSAWAVFAESLNIEEKYPGINGIGIILAVHQNTLPAYLTQQRKTRPDFDIFPAHDGALKLPITLIEPVAQNRAAVGLDVAHERNRLTALLRARDTRRPQITGPIILVQDAQKSPGFLFYAPYYRDATSADPAKSFVGAVYAPFVFHKLIEGVLGREQRLLRFSVRDGDEVLYDENTGASADGDGGFRKTVSVAFYGRDWTFDIWSTPQFRAATQSNEPAVILFTGLLIEALLIYLFSSLAKANKRAVILADRLAEAANKKAVRLEESIRELEKFAYVTSHDLKTPLRGMGYIVEYLREDLAALPEGSQVANDVLHNVQRIEEQIIRMDSLIVGILSYSSIRENDRILATAATREMAEGICADLNLTADQIVFDGNFPVLQTDVVRLEQVFANLIDNAVKYHPDAASLKVTLSARACGTRWRFSVRDNGPGIHPDFQERIFDMFQTLQCKSGTENTGIGLAIVQKIVELYGGKVEVSSEIGKGSCFTFDWPVAMPRPDQMDVAA